MYFIYILFLPPSSDIQIGMKEAPGCLGREGRKRPGAALTGVSLLLFILIPSLTVAEDGFTGFLERGKALSRAGMHEEAIEAFTGAIKLNPASAEAHYLRGSSYASLLKYGSALLDLNEAIKLDPKSVKAYIGLGIVHESLGDGKRAVRDFDEALRLDPKNAAAYNGRGAAYFSVNNYEEALRDYNKAIELDARFAQAYNNRGNVHASLKDYPLAIKDYDSAIEINPGYAMAYYNRGFVYIENMKDNRGYDDMRRAANMGYGAAREYLDSKGMER